MNRYKIVGKQYGKLAVIPATEPSEAMTIWLSWYSSPDGPQVERTGEATARFLDDGEEVVVKAA